jgi:hypothetical protein
MPVSRRKRRLWIAFVALAFGWVLFMFGKAFSSLIWFHECEGLTAPFFASLHCAAPFLSLGAGAALILTGGALLLLEIFHATRAVSSSIVILFCAGACLFSLVSWKDSPWFVAALLCAALLFLGGRFAERRIPRAPVIASVLVMGVFFVAYVAERVGRRAAAREHSLLQASVEFTQTVY